MLKTGMSGRGIAVLFVSVPVLTGSVLVASGARGGPPPTLPPVPAPPQNPITESKRVLGKILFWDEQLSSDNTVACGTCHIPNAAGSDPVLALNPGPDGLPGSPDDMRTSFGVIRSDELDDYQPDPVFALMRQATSRSAQPAIFAMYAPELFWDGRAASQFVDPQTGQTLIPVGGALESQVVAPPVSDVEMAHEQRDWSQIAAKLRRARPLGLAADVPPDVSGIIGADTTYPELFAAAFGDDEITGSRIAFAIATYERTLVPDQTPWDLFMQGDVGAMTAQQIQGWNFFQGSQCSICHQPPMFTDFSFRNIGVRPTAQDIGRQGVTGNPADRGRFKVPTLRNIGLKPSFMHSGDFQLLNTVFNFYLGPGAPGNNNRDPLLPIAIPQGQRDPMTDFLLNALTDPRVSAEEFPFDRPTLHVEQAPNPALLGGGTPGQGGFTPAIIARAPPNVGNIGFKVGLDRALGGTTARLIASETPPSAGVVSEDLVLGVVDVEGLGAGGGHATVHYPLPFNSFLNGRTLYVQWLVDDPSGPGGVARSRVARLDLFCTNGCPHDCAADIAEPFGTLDFSDVTRFLTAFTSGELVADVSPPASGYDFSDVVGFLTAFGQGCP
ncbi:MAG: cytochrome c peroxidase [Phycisphaerales bacterium]